MPRATMASWQAACAARLAGERGRRRVRRDFQHRVDEVALQFGAKQRLRSADAALIDQDEVAIGGRGKACLEAGVDCQRAAGTAADVNDGGLREGGLLRTRDDHDGKGEAWAIRVRVVARHADHAAA